MTNEEAIKIIKQFRDRQGNSNDDIEAFDLANKALEQQPCEDCISRESVRQLICKNNDKYGYSDRFHEFTEECLKLPSVTPQQKVGKWEELGIVMEGRMYEHGECDMQDAWVCDYCGYQVHMPTKYCPNCGAKMEVDE